MSIEIRAAEVHALASTLRGEAGNAAEIVDRLDHAGDVGDRLQAAAEAFLESHRTAARALAGELEWLGSTLGAVADSWLNLDRTLLATRNRMSTR
jgi:hypothetical protein